MTNYQEYLSSDHWANLRDKRIKLDHGMCRVCMSKEKLEVHHKIYRQNWNKTEINDLMTLCHICHGTVTDFVDIINKHSKEFTCDFEEAAAVHLYYPMVSFVRKQHLIPQFDLSTIAIRYKHLLAVALLQTDIRYPTGDDGTQYFMQTFRGR